MGVKRKIIISIAVVMAMIGLITYLIILPTISDINGIKRSVYLERVDLEKKYLKGQLLNKVLDDFEKTKTEKDKLTSVFITEGNELEFITSLEKIAETYDILQELKLDEDSEPRGKKFHKTSRLSIIAKGDFNQILEYLDEINSLSYYYSIDSIDMRASGGPINEEKYVTIDLAGNIFLVPNQE